MGKISVIKDAGGISGLYVISPAVFGDERGYFMETYNEAEFREAGIDCTFVQDNQSMSKRGVLRGLHYQINYPQDKLVRVISGEVYDVAVDLRKGSATFGKWYGVRLSAENKKSFFIPKNFAHGFLVLSESAEFFYKVTDFYHPDDEGGIRFDDPELSIDWPMEGMSRDEIILSEKDKHQMSFAEYRENMKQ
ncbi:MAG TPA: dTDP-4-dehydrorhamnose 3,5-epimerase [Lachnospiraceae bacterium]|nr:dTDP-4-dehydrorhamnose 3,5-epimerase [Lachnospiraceae bacterium]